MLALDILVAYGFLNYFPYFNFATVTVCYMSAILLTIKNQAFWLLDIKEKTFHAII